MNRYNRIKSVYNQMITNDLIISLAAEELSDEERAELEEELMELQGESEPSEEDESEEFTPEELEEMRELAEIGEEVPEELPEELEEGLAEEPEEEEVPETERVKMPSTIEKGQTITWLDIGVSDVPGVLKKYSPGAALAKECPVCSYQNRPITSIKCKNCKDVYNRLKRYIDLKREQDKGYNVEEAFDDLAKKYKYLNPSLLRRIFDTRGETDLKEITEVQSTPRKQLDDILWYRLNVKKDPKTGEPLLDKKGLPIPLDERKYFSTQEVAETLHISPEMLRSMVANYNAKVIKNLPDEAKKFVKRDAAGEIIPSSARQLARYGYIAPAVTIGAGMADVRRRLTREQLEGITPEKLEGLKGPAFKSVDLAAWNWDRLKNVFGWDESKQNFTHGWIKFLKEKFLPDIQRHKIESKIASISKVIERYRNIADNQREENQNTWDNASKGLKTYFFLLQHPDENIEDLKREFHEPYEEYRNNYWKIAQKKKVDNGVPKDVLQLLRNYDNRKDPLSAEERQIIVKSISGRLKVPEEKIENHLDIRDDVNELLYELPKEVEFITFLESNPSITKEQLGKRFKSDLKRLEKILINRDKIARQFDTKAKRLEEKLPELGEELRSIEIPEGFDLNKEVKKYYYSQTEAGKSFDPDPEISKDIEEAKLDVEEKMPKPEPPDPTTISAKKASTLSRIEKIIKLAIELETEEEPVKEEPTPEPMEPVAPEEEKEEEPTGEFGDTSGMYTIFFEWRPDFFGQPSWLKQKFHHTPGHTKMSFEELLKSKIEKQFVPRLIKFLEMYPPEDPKKITKKKYIHITVIEPQTERIKRFGGTLNKETGDLLWYGTSGVVERREKERRLNLWRYKDLKSEVDLGLIKLEDIELVGDNYLKVIEKELEPTKEEEAYKGIPQSEEFLRRMRELQKKRKEKITPEEAELLKEEVGLTWTPPKPEYKEPSEKPPEPAPIRKIIAKRSFIKKMMLKPIIDPMTGQPKRTPTGEVIKDLQEVVIPKIDHFLVSIRLDREGNPTSASCETIGVSYKETGVLTEKKTYPTLFTAVRNLVDRKRPHLKKEKLWEERKKLVNSEYEQAVKRMYGEKVEAWKSARKREPYLPESAVDMNIKPYPKCPQASPPFDKACEEIIVAINSIEGKEIPKDYTVYDWGSIKRKPSPETSKEMAQRMRRHDVTEFHG